MNVKASLYRLNAQPIFKISLSYIDKFKLDSNSHINKYQHNINYCRQIKCILMVQYIGTNCNRPSTDVHTVDEKEFERVDQLKMGMKL